MHASLQGLRAHLHAIAPPARHGHLALDGGAIDHALGGGLTLGALHSIEGQAIQVETGAAPAWFAASLLRHIPGTAPLFWVAQTTDLYPPGLTTLNLDPARLIHIRTIAEDETLAVTETLLRSGASAAVVAEAGRIARLAGHRLQMAALSHGTTCFLLRRFPWGSPPQADTITAAVTSWRIPPAPSLTLTTTRRPPPGPPRLHCALLHARTAPPASWIVEQEDLPHASHPFRVVAGLANPQAAPRRLAV
jgi:hypothetical protein